MSFNTTSERFERTHRQKVCDPDTQENGIASASRKFERTRSFGLGLGSVLLSIVLLKEWLAFVTGHDVS